MAAAGAAFGFAGTAGLTGAGLAGATGFLAGVAGLAGALLAGAAGAGFLAAGGATAWDRATLKAIDKI